MRLPGSLRAPISIRSGTPTATAITSQIIGAVSGTSTVLESLETTFQQDLNGDGVVGLTRTVIQTDGSTSLTEVGSNYFLEGSGGSGPELINGGAAVVAGQYGGWTPIGAGRRQADMTLPGMPGTDSIRSGTPTATATMSQIRSALCRAPSTVLEFLETTFQQDLNGDGVVGLTRTVIQTDGSTSLIEVAATISSMAAADLVPN